MSVVAAAVSNGKEADRPRRAWLLLGREECAADAGAHDPVGSLRATQLSDFSSRI